MRSGYDHVLECARHGQLGLSLQPSQETAAVTDVVAALGGEPVGPFRAVALGSFPPAPCAAQRTGGATAVDDHRD